MGLIAVSDEVNLRGFHTAPNRQGVFTPISVPRELFYVPNPPLLSCHFHVKVREDSVS